MTPVTQSVFFAKEYSASIRDFLKGQLGYFFIKSFGADNEGKHGVDTQFLISSIGERDAIFKDADKYIECTYNELDMDDVAPLEAAVVSISLAVSSAIGPTPAIQQFFDQALCKAAYNSVDPDPAIHGVYNAIKTRGSIVSSTNKRCERNFDDDDDVDDDIPTQPTKRRKTSQSSTPTIHHERQESRQCGKHAVNAIVAYAGKRVYGVDEMQLIARDKYYEQRAWGLQDNEIEVMSDCTGNYNVEVVINALKWRLGYEMDCFHSHLFTENDKITDEGLSALMEKKGIIICDGGHWLSLLPHSPGYLINMDSLLTEPQVLDKDQVRRIVDDAISSHNRKNRNTSPSIYYVPDDKCLVPPQAACYVTEAPKRPQRVQEVVKPKTETIRRRFVKAKRPQQAERKSKAVPPPRRKSKAVPPPRRKLKAIRPKRGIVPRPQPVKQVRWNLNRKRPISDGVEVESSRQRTRIGV